MNYYKCRECGKTIKSERFYPLGYLHTCSSCLFPAERSVAAQRCPPSAGGSADARAADETPAASLVRSADEAVRALIGHWRELANEAESMMNENNAAEYPRTHWLNQGRKTSFSSCADQLEAALSPALRAQPERARQPNE